MKRKTKIKPIAHKQAIKNLNAWGKDSANKTGRQYDLNAVKDYQNRLKPYLTKKGIVKKNLSQKRVKEFNALIEEIKKNPFSTRRGREEYKEKVKRGNERRYNTGVERGTYRDKEHYDNAQQIFEAELYEELRDNGYMASDQIIDMAQDMDDYTPDDIQDAFQYVLDTLEKNMPEEIKNQLEMESDPYLMAQLYLNAKREGIDLAIMQATLLKDIIKASDPLNELEKLRRVLLNTDYELQLIDSIETLNEMYKEV